MVMNLKINGNESKSEKQLKDATSAVQISSSSPRCFKTWTQQIGLSWLDSTKLSWKPNQTKLKRKPYQKNWGENQTKLGLIQTKQNWAKAKPKKIGQETKPNQIELRAKPNQIEQDQTRRDLHPGNVEHAGQSWLQLVHPPALLGEPEQHLARGLAG